MWELSAYSPRLQTLLKDLRISHLGTLEIRDVVGGKRFGRVEVKSDQRFSVGKICGATVWREVGLIVDHPG